MQSTSPLSLLSLTLLALLLPSSSSAQSFQRTIYDNPRTPVDIFVSDLNRDGKPDILTAAFDGQNYNVFLNHGDGTFTSGSSGSFLIAGDDITRVVAADLNGDGIPDVVTQGCGSGGAVMSVQFGNGDGTFVETRDYELTQLPSSCTDALGFITLAHSTLPSLILSTVDSRISIKRNDGTGFFLQEQDIQGNPVVRYSGISTGDYNGDSLQDIAAISSDPGGTARRVVIFYQKPDGTFKSPVTIFTSDAGLQSTQTVDLNGDSKGDLLVPFFGGPTQLAGVVAFTNLGGGSFSSTMLTVDPFYIGVGPKPAAIHPVGKNPGLRGILLPLAEDNTIVKMEPVVALFPAQGTGWGAPIYLGDPGGTGPQAISNGDFNGDGRPDFAVVDKNNHLLVFLNTTTASTCPYPTGSTVTICSPANATTLNSTTVPIHVAANSGINAPIGSITATIDGIQVAASDMGTLDASVTASKGSHLLNVVAVDAVGNQMFRSATFTVQ
jgi:FG-GAP-like repeat